ncbi:MAG: hypothetical protein HYY03_03350 [Chloroflexi bacterium]|nr:hypothetical protein [Chloroflexota bacterium]
MRTVAPWAIAAVAGLVLLSACGGGGGEGTPAPARQTPPPEVTAEVTPEVEEEEAPDLSDVSFVDNLLAKEEAGEWTRGEGLVATLKLFAGELDAAGVLRHPELLNREGTGILEMAYEYLEDGPDADARSEVGRLLDLLVLSNSRLEAMAGISPPAAAAAGVLAPGPPRGPVEDCAAFFSGYQLPPGLGQCVEVGISSYLEDFYTGKFRFFFPAPGLPKAGWTDKHLQLAISAMEHTVPIFDKLGKLPPVNVIFAMKNNPKAWAVAAPTPEPVGTPSGTREPCGIALFPAMQQAADGDFKQTLAHELAHCLQGQTFPGQMEVDYEVKKWWEEGLADYLSNVAYPDVNQEWGPPPERRAILNAISSFELSTTLFDRAYTNWIFFQYLYHEIGNEGIFKLIKTLPDSGGRADQEAALADYPNIDRMYHEFAKALTDGRVQDASGELIPYPINEANQPTVLIAGQRLILWDSTPFGVFRARIAVAPGKQADLHYEWEGSALDSARVVPDVEWTDLPDELPDPDCREEAILLVTTTKPGDAFELDISPVVDLPGGGPVGAAGLVGEWVVDNDSIQADIRRWFPETRIDSISGAIRVTFRDDREVEVIYENFSVKGHSEGDSRLALILGEPELYTETTITTNARGTTPYKASSLPVGDLIQFGSLFEADYLEGTETVEYHQARYELGFGGDPDAIPVDEIRETTEEEPTGTDLISAVRDYQVLCQGAILLLDEVVLHRVTD